MAGDTLSDLLRAVRLRGAIFFYVDGSAPWVAEAPPARTIIPASAGSAQTITRTHRGGR
jgi:hypothetical protein